METTTEPPPSVLQIASMFASLSRQHHQNVRSRGAAGGGRRIISENSTETFRTVNSNAASSTTSVVYFSNRGGNNNGSIRTRSRSSDSRPTRLDLKMIDNRSKFNEVKALFENLERQSRQEQKQRTPHNNKKRVASPSPTRSCGIRNEQYTDEPKAPGRTVAPFSNTTKSILPNTSAPPVPPKPKVAESPTSTTEIRRPVFQRSWTTDSSSTTVQQNGGDGDYLQVGTRGRSLEKEVTDKGDTKMADTTDEMDGPQKSSIYSYEPYWRSNRYARQRLANGDVPVSERPQSPPNSQVNPKRNYTLKTDSLDNNSVGSDTSATLVQQKNDPGRLDITWPPPTATATAQTPMTIVRSPTEENKDSGVVTDSPSTSTTDSRASSSANALPPNTSFSNSTATVEDWTKSCLGTQTTKTDEEQSNVALMTKEEASVLLSPSTRDVVLRENPGRTNGEAGGEIRSLPSHLSIPQDVDHKRHSMCSMDSTSEQGGTASDRYSMLDDGNVNVLPDGHFWIEVPGLLDPSPPPSPTDTLTFKKPSRVKFSNAPIKVYSTYTGLEYDRRNDDIDPVSASAEFELERRLEKMDVIEVELQKGPEGLGFSIIGMGVGADAGLEKLGIFVKSITPGGAVHRDGRILVCDQIVEVDGQSLVGVSQNYAASVLRSTSGTVRFKIGREKDLDNSEIAALIRQSLEQDRIMREQEELFQRRLSAGNGNEDGEMREMEKSKFGGISDQDNSSGWIHRTTHQSPLPSTDSVFTHDNEEETEEHVVGSDQHLERLMAQLRQPFKSQNTNQQQQKQENPVESIKTVSLINIEQKSKESEDQDKSTLSPAYSDNIKSLAFRSDLQRENVIDEFPPAYTPPESISRLANYSVQMDEMERRFASNETGSDVLYHATVQPCFDTWPSTKTAIPTSVSPEFGQLRRSTPDLTSSTDSMNGSEIQTKINTLEAELSHIRDETDKYQTLLNESKVQFDTLEKKYDRAQKLIKNYQNREKDLLNREELHLRELCEKDQQYANLVKMLKEKVIGLEKQLQDAHRKRASIVDPQSTTGLGKNTNQSGSDISPALAYQPAKKLGPICDEKYAMDVGKKESATCTKMAPTIGTAHIVPIIRHSSAVLPEFIGAKVIDSKRHASTDLGVPTTELLDSKAAKCKVEAVKQSQVMSARALPTRRPETEVFIMCHHTMENAQTLRAHATGGHCGAGDSDHADQSGQLVSCSTDSTSKSISLTSNNGSPLTPRRLAQRAAMLLRKKTSTTLSHLDRSSASVIVGSGDPGKVPAVLTWTCDDVCRFLKSNGLEKYTPEFSINRVDGCKLLQLDGSRLKAMGVQNHSDRSLIKKQIKEMKAQIERERKQLEKESRRLLKLEKDKKNQPSKS